MKTKTELNQEELSKVIGGITDEDNRNYSIKITSYNCSKETVVKLIKEMLAIGLKEAQELVDSLPKMIKENMTESEAYYWKNRFASNNIMVTIENH